MAYLQSSGACGVAIGTVSEKGKYVYVIYDTTVCSPTTCAQALASPEGHSQEAEEIVSEFFAGDNYGCDCEDLFMAGS